MKKLLPVLLVLLLLMAAVPALAGGPTGGMRPLRLPTLVSRDLSFSIAGPSSGITGVEYTWYVRDTSEKTGRTYEYSIGKDDHSYPDENVTDTQYTVKQSSQTFRWTCYDPGDYYIFVQVYESDGTDAGYDYEYFRIDANPEGDALQTAVQELAASCLRGDEYHTALAIFDWLIENVEYDDSYSYYTADAAILNHCSVCNGYAKAFTLLANEAGLQASRALGSTLLENGEPDPNGGHAWNVVKVNGNWYQLDATWGASSKDHIYFLVDDDLIKVERHQDKCDIGNVTCSSMASNYYIVEEFWPTMCASLIDGVEQGLEEGLHTIYYQTSQQEEVNTEKWIYSNDAYCWHLLGKVAAAALPLQTFSRQNGEPLTAPCFEPRYSYDLENYWFCADYLAANISYLPADLTAIETEAFAGASLYAAAIPEGCVSIGARAFADTPLWEIDIPATVTDIDDTAFEGLTDLLIITPEDSPAIQYAEQKGIKYLPY